MNNGDKLRKVIALDFDGCLCDDCYPDIGLPNWGVINRAIREKENGAALLLWTCREGEMLEAAVRACESWGIILDGVNVNFSEWARVYNNDTRKVGATEYWDDRAVNMPRELLNIREAEISKKAVEKWGCEMQILIAVEEMSELQKELLKMVRWERTKSGNLPEIMERITEERADVEIMLRQLEVMMGDCWEWKRKKLDRLENLIKGTKGEARA